MLGVDHLQGLAARHRAYFAQEEEQAFREARNLYRGLPAKFESGRVEQTLAWNYVFAVCESAVASLLGGDIQVHAIPRDRKAIQMAADAADLVNLEFDLCDFQSEITMALVDAVLTGRGVLKTRWSFENDRATIEACDPAQVFFDLSARRPKAIRYWLQPTPVHISEWKRRTKGQSPIYKRSPGLKDIEPVCIPEWLQSKTQSAADPAIPEYIVVWEAYQKVNGGWHVTHWEDSSREVLLEDDLDYCPFTLVELNSNGLDCRGLSEVTLILRAQEIINAILEQAWKIASVGEPVDVFDASVIEQDDLAKVHEAAGNPGRMVGVRTKGAPVPLGDLFHAVPTPEIPTSNLSLLEILPKVISFVSALSDSQRGQVSGAKLATELAIIDSQMRTRLKAREHRLNAAIEKVAEVVLHLATTRSVSSVVVPRGGTYSEVEARALKGIRVDLKLTAYNALRASPLLEAEQVQAMLPIAMQFQQVVSADDLVRHLYRLRGLPEPFLKDPEQAALQAQAALQQMAAAQPTMPQVPVEEPPMEEVQSPNTIQAQARMGVPTNPPEGLTR